MSKLDRIEKLENELALLRKDIQSDNDLSSWEPKGGDYWITTKGDVCNGGSSNPFKLFGMEFKTRKEGDEAVEVYRRFHRLYKLQQELDNGWIRNDDEKVYEIVNGEEGLDVITFSGNSFAVICFKTKKSAEKAIEIIKAGGL